MNTPKRIYNKLFLDKKGHFVIAQKPNAPLIIWLIGLLASKAVNSSPWHELLGYISTVALIVWAVLELLNGVNYFRRLLGVAALIFIVATKV